MNNKRGLSDIIVTMIIVLLSIVAVGVVWVVVRNLLSSSTSGIDITSKCINVNIEIASASCADGSVNETCNLVLSRTGTGSDEIGGVKIVFRDEVVGASSPLLSLDGNIAPLVGKTANGIDSGIANANSVSKVEVTAFFKDGSGNEKLCSQTTSLSW